MFNLEQMEVCGFKSFSDRTQIRFPRGITSIVGPNGCGKSNIGDAINWVLGEQSAKMLRGHQMSDVIFSGSAGRKPLGLAEVTLTFGSASGLPADDHGKVVVTRRLFRSGESEYLMNGARTRLKDIQEVLRQAKVGARTYATIEQGKIDQVLNAKPKERRALIEDAAGVSGYKHKRRLAELKLEATHANLLRVNDIVGEVQRQINSLKRQAAKARRYRRLREELRAKELVRFSSQARALQSELERLQVEERGARDADAQAAATLGRQEASVIEQREALDRANASFRELSEGLHRHEMEIDRGEAQIRSCRERAAESRERVEALTGEAGTLQARRDELEAQKRRHEATLADRDGELSRVSDALSTRQQALAEADGQMRSLREQLERERRGQFEAMTHAAELRNRVRSTEEGLERIHASRSRLELERDEAQRDLSRIRSGADALKEEASQHRARVAELRGDHGRTEDRLRQVRLEQTELVERLAEARERAKAAVAQLATLEDVETRFAGVSDGVKNLLASAGSAGIRTHGVVADYVEASREIEGAAEGYLAWLLPTVILEDQDDACRAVSLLRAQGAGRTSLICRSNPGASSNGVSATPRDILEHPRVRGRLKDRLRLNTSANGVVASRIGDALLVDDLESALELHRRYPGVDYLTPAGEVVYKTGVITAGGNGVEKSGLLAHRRRTEEVRDSCGASAAQTAALQERVECGRQESVRLEVAVREQREALDDAERRGVALELNVERSAEDGERGGRRSEVLVDELAVLLSESAALKLSLEQGLTERNLAEETHQQSERAIAGLSEQLEAAEAQTKQLLEEVAQLRAEQAATRQRQESAADDGRRVEEIFGDLVRRLQSVLDESRASADRAGESETLREQTERELGQLIEQRARKAEQAGQREREIAEMQQALARQDGELHELRGNLERLRERTREAELGRARAESARQHLDDLCRQELGMAASEAIPAVEEPATDEPFDAEALDEEVARIKRLIEDVGPVNMTAIEEFSELEERHRFLSSQHQDLEKSIESLRESIRRINRQSRQRFTEAFEHIRTSYQEVFKLLFRGGRADLRLEEGEDVLDCGIEILAQPPGKRLTGVHLLSGGEKALSAIALLFAIFRYQPSPFCLLDEVDAALDDANVSRFANMVREYAKHTQFILITHNKLSMEVADLLYGVTMEEPGVSRLVSLQLQ